MTTNFSILENKIKHFISSNDFNFNTHGLDLDQFVLLTHRAITSSSSNILILTENPQETDHIYDLINALQIVDSKNIYRFYSNVDEVYSEMFPSDTKFYSKFQAMASFSSTQNKNTQFIISDFPSVLEKFPCPSYFKDLIFEIKTGDIIDCDELSEYLVDLGYNSVLEIDEPGSFINKGEVVDIFPSNTAPIRIYFDLNKIERIKYIGDGLSNEGSINSITISFAPNIVFEDSFRDTLKSKIPNYNLENKDLLLTRREILSKINQKIPFQNFQYFFTTAFPKLIDIFSFFEIKNCIISSKENYEQILSIIIDRNNVIDLNDFANVLPKPNDIFLNNINPKDGIKFFNILKFDNLNDNRINTSTSIENIDDYISSSNNFSQNTNATDKLNALDSLLKKGYILNIVTSNQKAAREIISLLNENNENHIYFNLLNLNINNGFIDHASKIIYLNEQNIFSKKIATKKAYNQIQNDDLFAEQIANLNIGDFVIHKTHGLGRYLGLVEMDSNGAKSDFIFIEYDKDDKVYIPIYRINEIQKHASSEVSSLKLANLRTKNFLLQKQKIQNSIKKLAFDLIQLQAKRSLANANSFSPPNHEFEEFELSFPFEETPDQARAIDRVINDMQKSTPMDHLVCGDVGFGKTEVAIRAAFKAALDNKQVAVLVPTTILALQHYNSFFRRLKNTGAIVKVLTRFQSKKEAEQIIIDLKNGKIDILIGTHKILSDKIQFNDLGLVIIDEEQRFGVNHKEKFKTLKESLDFLTLTATPIPRTMQQSLLGLKEISLIKTPPPNRQAINTYICLEEDQIIKEAIEKEVQRGGQVFIVNNNVKNLDSIFNKLKNLVPNIKISISHGQLPEKELEKTILDFYRGNSQILLATTIIESGIDIPNANTMIVLNSDKFGLSQLHQLRGRIGRSERKAFVYFTIKSHSISEIAYKRLKSLQRFSDLGAGFSIANSDLEIRGAGNIIGGDQSGHLDQIGLELYSELLEEAINDLKGQKKNNPSQTEINTVFPAFIPSSFINNNKMRLKIYKKLSNLKDNEALEFNQNEIEDQYGKLPIEFLNLISILKLRVIFSGLCVKSLVILKKQLTLQFDEELLKNNQLLVSNLISLFTKNPKTYQLTQDYKFHFFPKSEITTGNFFQISKDIADNIIPC